MNPAHGGGRISVAGYLAISPATTDMRMNMGRGRNLTG